MTALSRHLFLVVIQAVHNLGRIRNMRWLQRDETRSAFTSKCLANHRSNRDDDEIDGGSDDNHEHHQHNGFLILHQSTPPLATVGNT